MGVCGLLSRKDERQRLFEVTEELLGLSRKRLLCTGVHYPGLAGFEAAQKWPVLSAQADSHHQLTVAPGTTAGDPYSVTVVAEDSISSTNQTFNWTVICPVTSTNPAYPGLPEDATRGMLQLVTLPPRVGMAN